MEIHRLIKAHFDNDENYRYLPKSVKLAYIEIELYEKGKIKKALKTEELENNNKILTPLEKKMMIKNDFIKLRGSVNNQYGFLAYVSVLYKWKITNYITTKILYENFNLENIFIYCYHYCLKNLKCNGIDNYCLLELFKNFIIQDDLEILNHIFLSKEIIFTENLNKEKRTLNYIVFYNNEYYVMFNEMENKHNNYILTIVKLIPIEIEGRILYHFRSREKEKIQINISNQLYEKVENKIKHIKIYDDFYFIMNK